MHQNNTIYTVLPLDSEMFLEIDDEILRSLEKRNPEYAKRNAEITEILTRNHTVRDALEQKIINPFSEEDVRDVIRIHELYWLNNIPEHMAFYHAGAKNTVKMITDQ